MGGSGKQGQKSERSQQWAREQQILDQASNQIKAESNFSLAIWLYVVGTSISETLGNFFKSTRKAIASLPGKILDALSAPISGGWSGLGDEIAKFKTDVQPILQQVAENKQQQAQQKNAAEQQKLAAQQIVATAETDLNTTLNIPTPLLNEVSTVVDDAFASLNAKLKEISADSSGIQKPSNPHSKDQVKVTMQFDKQTNTVKAISVNTPEIRKLNNPHLKNQFKAILQLEARYKNNPTELQEALNSHRQKIVEVPEAINSFDFALELRLRHYSIQKNPNNELIGALTLARQPNGRNPHSNKINQAVHHSSYTAATGSTTALQDIENAKLYAEYIIIETQEEMLRPQHEAVMAALRNDNTLIANINGLQVEQSKPGYIHNAYIAAAKKLNFNAYDLCAIFLKDDKNVEQKLIAEFATKAPKTEMTDDEKLRSTSGQSDQTTSVAARQGHQQQNEPTGFHTSTLHGLNHALTSGPGATTPPLTTNHINKQPMVVIG